MEIGQSTHLLDEAIVNHDLAIVSHDLMIVSFDRAIVAYPPSDLHHLLKITPCHPLASPVRGDRTLQSVPRIAKVRGRSKIIVAV